jgi:hypothetical protein
MSSRDLVCYAIFTEMYLNADFMLKVQETDKQAFYFLQQYAQEKGDNE